MVAPVNGHGELDLSTWAPGSACSASSTSAHVMTSGRFPFLATMAETGVEPDHLDEWFEFGLRRMLDGLTVLLNRGITPSE